MAALLFILITPVIFLSTHDKSRRSAQIPRTITAQGAKAALAQTTAQPAVTLTPEQQSAAAENLRRALLDPWNSRRVPASRIENAIAEFGRDRALALPILMEVLNMPRGQRPFEAFILACHGLQVLGPNAMPAWPEIRQHLSEFGPLNDGVPKLLAALSPDGAIIPDLIDALKQPELIGASWIGEGINTIVNANPTLAGACQNQLGALLQSAIPEIQLRAACVLARLPGPKNSEVLPILLSNLNLEKLRDPHAYDPIVNGTDVRLQDNERMNDESARLAAVQALRDFGPEAEAAAPVLLEIARLIPSTDLLHDFALVAAKAIKTDLADFEADERTLQRLRGLELADRAKNGGASYDELVEGLGHREAAAYAATQLAALGERARPAIPQALAAIDSFKDYDSVQLIKELQPDLLVDRLAVNNLKGIDEVAGALGELGPKMSGALPHLERIFNQLSATDFPTPFDAAENESNLSAIAAAIQKINPNSPKLIFHFEDLDDASTALLNAIYADNKIRSPVYNAYITKFQDHNVVARPKLIDFANATKEDPELHRVFVDALVKKNPSLAADLANDR